MYIVKVFKGREVVTVLFYKVAGKFFNAEIARYAKLGFKVVVTFESIND